MKTLFASVATVFAIVALGAVVGAHASSEDPPAPGPGPMMMEGPFGPGPGGRVVKGQPFSAQTVTELTQTLADGNRIVQKTEGAMYRDGEGRTRREHMFTGIGPMPLGAEMGGRQVITIDDVVAGVQYALDPQAKTARQMPRWNRGMGPGEPARKSAGPMDRIPPGVRERTGGAPPARESLGTKTIEGLEADGTRTTITIPAGQIGNEAPIVIVNERWVSKELQVPILMRFSDPRMGERVYRLTAIARGEPSPQLFAVPADYKIIAGPERPMREKRVP